MLKLEDSLIGCPFYGFFLSLKARVMVPQRGNQCALIKSAYDPCYMEIQGKEPDWKSCVYNNTPNNKSIEEIANFQVLVDDPKIKKKNISLKEWCDIVLKSENGPGGI